MKSNFKNFLVCLLLCIPMFSNNVYAQFIADWGQYCKDYVTSDPTLDFTMDDRAEQIAMDRYVEDIGDTLNVEYITGLTNARSDYDPNACLSTTQGLNYGGGDAFLAKYDDCGNLSWFKYLGVDKTNSTHNCAEDSKSVALDHNNGKTYIYIAGYTFQSNGPCSNSTNSAAAFSCYSSCTTLQPNKNSDVDGFIAKYDQNGNLLKWTYLGGSGVDYIYSIDVFNHDVYVAGYTQSNPFVTASATYDNTNDGAGDAFVAILDSSLCTCKFFTYIGGTSEDRNHCIRAFNLCTGGDCNTQTPTSQFTTYFYVSGSTNGDMTSNVTYNPINSFHGTSGGTNNDAFISLWSQNTSGTGFSPLWLRYVGGGGDDLGRQIALVKYSDGSTPGDIIQVGHTSSSDLISNTTWQYPTSHFYRSTHYGGKDGFIAKFSRTGIPIWGTYFGGSDQDYSSGVARYYSPNGLTYYVAVCGGTLSTDLPLANQVQNNLGGLRDAWVAVLTDPTDANTTQQLNFSTYFGGGKDEIDDVYDTYGPFIGIGVNKEIFLDFYTKSKNIESKITSTGYYHNSRTTTDEDIFLARIYNTSITGYTNCTSFGWRKGLDKPLDKISLEIIPDPATTFIKVSLKNNLESSFGKLTIYNSLGLTVWQSNVGLDNLYDGLNIDLKSLPSGLFYIALSTNSEKISSKFIKF